MNSVNDIGLLELALFGLVLLIPFTISHHYRLGIIKNGLISVLRMTLQLALVGLYLEYLFVLNSIWVNALWLIVMLLVGSSAIINKTHLPRRCLLLPLFTSLIVSLIPILGLLIYTVIKPEPFYSAQYVIPLSGMLIGNSMGGNIIALQNLFNEFQQREPEYHAALSLGASPRYAATPFVQQALKKAMTPTLASISTIGLVSLPGMMTGQILSGASPLVAIKYQLVIMIAIFAMLSLSVCIAIELTLRRIQTVEGRITVKPQEK